MSEKPEACPWCNARHDRNGNGPHIISRVKTGPEPLTPDKFKVECFSCGASGPYAKTQLEAARRFYALTARVEALEAGLREATEFLDGAATALANRQDENHKPVRRAARRARTALEESHDK